MPFMSPESGLGDILTLDSNLMVTKFEIELGEDHGTMQLIK